MLIRRYLVYIVYNDSIFNVVLTKCKYYRNAGNIKRINMIM